MPNFKIDLSAAKLPSYDGEVNEYINPEAASIVEQFSKTRKVIFVNGMGNSGRDHAESAMALSGTNVSGHWSI